MGRFEIVLGRLKIVVDRCGIVADRCGIVVDHCGSLWIVVDRCGIVADRCGIVVDHCGSLWIVVGRCGSFRVLVTTNQGQCYCWKRCSLLADLNWFSSFFCLLKVMQRVTLPIDEKPLQQ